MPLYINLKISQSRALHVYLQRVAPQERTHLSMSYCHHAMSAIAGCMLVFIGSLFIFPLQITRSAPKLQLAAAAASNCQDEAEAVSPVIMEPHGQEYPDVDGGRVVWQDLRYGPTDIFMTDIPGGAATNVTASATWEIFPDLDGDRIVWKDGYDGIGIHGIDLISREVFTVTTGHVEVSAPKLSGDVVVWADNRAGDANWNIYGYDIVAQEEFVITDAPGNQYNPQIDDRYVVWWDFQEQIFLYDFVTRATTRLTTSWGARMPDVSAADNLVVWQDLRNGDWDLYGYDLTAAAERSLVIAPNDQESPSIAHGTVVYQSRSGTDSWNIHGYDLAQDAAFLLTNDPNRQVLAATDGDLIVWQDNRNHQQDIYYAHESDTLPVSCEREVFGLQVGAFPARRVELSWDKSNGEAGAYRIERSKGITGTTWSAIGLVEGEDSAFSDLPDEVDESYWYRVQALDSAHVDRVHAQHLYDDH